MSALLELQRQNAENALQSQALQAKNLESLMSSQVRGGTGKASNKADKESGKSAVEKVLKTLLNERIEHDDMPGYMDTAVLQMLFQKGIISVVPGADALLARLFELLGEEPTISRADAHRFSFILRHLFEQAAEESGFQHPFRTSGASRAQQASSSAHQFGFVNQTGTCSAFQLQQCSTSNCRYKHACFLCIQLTGRTHFHPAALCQKNPDQERRFPFPGCDRLQRIASVHPSRAQQGGSVSNSQAPPARSDQADWRVNARGNSNGTSPDINFSNLIAALENMRHAQK